MDETSSVVSHLPTLLTIHIWIPGTSPVRYFCGAFAATAAAGVSSWRLLEPREIVCERCVAAVSTSSHTGNAKSQDSTETTLARKY